jgi:hypothetical protein
VVAVVVAADEARAAAGAPCAMAPVLRERLQVPGRLTVQVRRVARAVVRVRPPRGAAPACPRGSAARGTTGTPWSA